MKQLITTYLSKYIDLSDDVIDVLVENLPVKEFKKNTVLLKEGELCNECYFVLKGLIRSYYVKDGDEVTTDFHIEEQAATPSCYGTGKPSELYLECMEDTIAMIGTPALEDSLLKQYPVLETMSRIMTDKIMAAYKEHLDLFKLASPEERYLHLVKNNPALIQRVPQYYIAAYLGMKPESLSRIRRRLAGSSR